MECRLHSHVSEMYSSAMEIALVGAHLLVLQLADGLVYDGVGLPIITQVLLLPRDDDRCLRRLRVVAERQV